LLLFVTFFIVRKFYKLLFTVETGVKFVTFCYFFLLFVTFLNYFLLLRRARVYIVFIVRGGKGCALIFFLYFFFLLRGRGVEVNVFFPPRYMKRWKEEGGKGYIFILEMFFFIVERLGRGRRNLGFQNHYGTEGRVHQEKRCKLIFFFSFFYC
jgi:hypothetical protein